MKKESDPSIISLYDGWISRVVMRVIVDGSILLSARPM